MVAFALAQIRDTEKPARKRPHWPRLAREAFLSRSSCQRSRRPTPGRARVLGLEQRDDGRTELVRRITVAPRKNFGICGPAGVVSPPLIILVDLRLTGNARPGVAARDAPRDVGFAED